MLYYSYHYSKTFETFHSKRMKYRVRIIFEPPYIINPACNSSFSPSSLLAPISICHQTNCYNAKLPQLVNDYHHLHNHLEGRYGSWRLMVQVEMWWRVKKFVQGNQLVINSVVLGGKFIIVIIPKIRLVAKMNLRVPKIHVCFRNDTVVFCSQWRSD